MNDSIIIGKHTLESLTIGMYADAFTIYREYIQNAADAIDLAVKNGVIKLDNSIIKVNVDNIESRIIIYDNGIGIASDQAYKILCDIGNSTKDYTQNRGFRGIGRLGGLGYAEKLIFETTAKGDKNKAIVQWDCLRLKELLQPGKYNEYDLLTVIKEVVTISIKDEKINEHYFKVILENVNSQFSDLLDENEVQDYLESVAPIPFDCQKFLYAQNIKEKILSINKPVEEYKIILNDSPQQILKQYKKNFRTGHQERNRQSDHITGIEFFDGYDENQELIFLGWIGLCQFKGTIQDEYMQGIKIRKGNIMIGNETTFSQFFSTEKYRANKNFIGEIYIFWKDIIPNARRDDFEKNKEFNLLFKKLNEIADNFNKKYRRGYSQVNSAIRKMEDGLQQINEINDKIVQSGITSITDREKLLSEKKQIETKINIGKNELEKLINKNDVEIEKKKEAKKVLRKHMDIQKQLIDLENNIINEDFKGKEELAFLTQDEMNIYSTIIEVIDKHLEKEKAHRIHEQIIIALKVRKKKKKK